MSPYFQKTTPIDRVMHKVAPFGCGAVTALLLALTPLASAHADNLAAPKPAEPAITLDVQTIRWNPDNRADFAAGELEWAGGIELNTDDKRFGGWSAISVSADGSTLVSISDEAHWLSAQILYDEKGRLSGLADAHIAPLLDLKGKPIKTKEMGDAEGLATTGTDPLKGQAYVSFERNHRIWRYDLKKSGFAAVPTQVVTGRRLGTMPSNSGIEALTTLLPETGGDKQKLLALTEDARNPNGNRKAFIIEGSKVERLSTKLDEPFKPTDVARLPNGDLLILERSFSLLAGPGFELRLVRGADVKAGATLKGTILLQTNNRHTIDNMECLAVRSGEKGEILVYLMSDDNYSPLQHTYLMMFRLKPDVLAVDPPERTTAPASGVLMLPRSQTKAE